MLLKIEQNSQENTCAIVSFLIKLQAWGQLRATASPESSLKPGMALCRVSKGMASLLLVIYSSNLFRKCFVLVQSYERWGCVSSSILQKEKRNELIFRNLKSTLSKCETLLDSVSLVSPKYTYINYSKPITSCFAFFSNNFFNKSYIKWNINSHCKNIISNK